MIRLLKAFWSVLRGTDDPEKTLRRELGAEDTERLERDLNPQPKPKEPTK